MTLNRLERRETALRQITAEQFLYLGTPEVVYLRPSRCDGKEAFIICGADGNRLGVADDMEDALTGIAERGLGLATLH